jgi:SP family arabinose:H+ symporter-like MFS transporter
MNRNHVWYVSLIAGVAALGGLLFGYDTAVIAGAIGFLKTKFQLDAAMEGWAVSCALIGCILGAMAAGVLSDLFGRKKVLIFAAFLFLISAIGSALPRTLTEFVFARMVGGMGVGIASLISPLYIAEISPAYIRGRLVSLNQLAIVSGMLIIYFINAWIAGRGNELWNVTLGWRWMFASETIPAMLFFILLLVVPESPRWLIKQNKEHTAERIFRKVMPEEKIAPALFEIKDAIAHESGSVLQLFQPGLRTALVIGVVLAVLQQVTGINAILYYAPEIFKAAGTGTNAALLQTVLVGFINVAFTFVAIYTVDNWGRKTLLLFGSAGMGVSLLVIGFAFHFSASQGWLLLPFVLLYIACFASSMGPVVWVVMSEIFPTRIRGTAMSIATVILWISCYAVSQTFPMFVESVGSAFTFWIYMIMAVVTFSFVLKVLPETKGRTLEEIESSWGDSDRGKLIVEKEIDMFCPKCRSEYQAGITFCEQCKVDLVETLPPEDELVYQELTTVFTTGDEGLIQLIKSLLEEADIPCFARSQGVQDLFALGRMGTGYSPITGPVEIQVPRDRADEARELLKELDTRG